MSMVNAVFSCTMSKKGRWAPVAERLAQAVDNAFASRSELAEKLHMDTSTVSLWLSGKRTPRLETFLHVAELTGVPLSVLLGEAPRADRAPVPPQEPGGVLDYRAFFEKNGKEPLASPGSRRREEEAEIVQVIVRLSTQRYETLVREVVGEALNAVDTARQARGKKAG